MDAMTDHEIDKLTERIAARLDQHAATVAAQLAAHVAETAATLANATKAATMNQTCLVCRDAKAAAALIRMADDWASARRAGIGAMVLILCGALAGAVWIGFKIQLLGK